MASFKSSTFPPIGIMNFHGFFFYYSALSMALLIVAVVVVHNTVIIILIIMICMYILAGYSLPLYSLLNHFICPHIII